MVPYLILLFVPLLFSLFAYFPDKRRGSRRIFIAMGNDRKILNNSFMMPVFFFILFILLSLRAETVGNDVQVYSGYFYKYSNLSFKEIISMNDPLYWILCWSISQLTDNFRWMMVVTAAIILMPIAKLYCEDREYGFLKIVLFVNMTTFIMMFSGFRQAIAFSVGTIAYRYVRERKPLKFLFFVLVAIGFHHSAFMLLFLYPLYYLKIKRKHLIFVVPFLTVVFVFNRRIFTVLTQIFAYLFGESYDSKITSTGAITTLILFIIFAVFCYIMTDEKKSDRELIGLRNILLMAVLLQCFAPVHTLAMRLNYYYIIFIPLAISKALQNTKKTMQNLVRPAYTVLVVFFTVYFLYIVYRGCLTGNSALHTYPYIPFWEQ